MEVELRFKFSVRDKFSVFYYKLLENKSIGESLNVVIIFRMRFSLSLSLDGERE